MDDIRMLTERLMPLGERLPFSLLLLLTQYTKGKGYFMNEPN
jgi:hypothetical protein